MGLSLREAARKTGRSRSTILRAIQAGGLSVARKNDRLWSIDASELFRVYEPKPSTAARADTEESVGRDAPDAPLGTAPLEAEIRALQAMIASERERRAEDRQRMIEMRVEHSERIIELQAERDDWREQAKRSLALPSPEPPGQRRWWWRLRSAATA
jgi:hypothetical protein